jgi:hypothetical protein
LKSLTKPLFSPISRAFLKFSIFLSSVSSNLSAALITSLSDLYLPDEITPFMKSSKCDSNKIDVFFYAKKSFAK